MQNIAPTKSNLIKAKTSLKLSKEGYTLLDKKRNVLIRELMSLIDEAKEVQEKMVETFAKAYAALQTANITMGISTVESVALGIPESDDVDIILKSVMGVEIPRVKKNGKGIEPRYSAYRTNPALDQAYKHFLEVKNLTYQLAETENAVYRLATEIKKTQKRANALNNIMIPRYEEIVKFITDTLEEKDREEFSRLKVLKRRKSK